MGPTPGSRSQGSLRRWDQGPGRQAPGPAITRGLQSDHQPGLKRDTIAHLAAGAFLTEASNIVLLRPPGTGKTHLATGLRLRATQLGHRVLFATAIDWVARLQAAHQGERLPQELVALRRYGLIIVDKVGYIPFEQDAADPIFQLVPSRYEHASLILTSNLPFARGETSSAIRSSPRP